MALVKILAAAAIACAAASAAPNTEPGEPGNPMQAAKLCFKYPAYYVHGTNQSDSIGESASHGCIRMYPEDVNTLAEIIQRAGGEGRSEDWFNRMRSSDTNMVEVDLPNPVAIEVHG